MFPKNFQVLKIPARSTLLRAKCLESLKASTSATLAARGGSEGDLGCFGRCRRAAFTGSAVDILFRRVGGQKNLWPVSLLPRTAQPFHSFLPRGAASRPSRSKLPRHRFVIGYLLIRQPPPQPARRYWSSSPVNAPSSGRQQWIPGSLPQGTPVRHPSPATTNG